MLWSLIKIVLFFVVLVAVAFGASFLLETEGGIRVVAAGQEYNLGPLESVIALALLVLAVWVFLKLIGLLVVIWHVVRGDETAWSCSSLSRSRTATRRAISMSLTIRPTGVRFLSISSPRTKPTASVAPFDRLSTGSTKSSSSIPAAKTRPFPKPLKRART